MSQRLGKKESINFLECCEKTFMEEWIIKLYSKNNCGLSPDIALNNNNEKNESSYILLDLSEIGVLQSVSKWCLPCSSSLLTCVCKQMFFILYNMVLISFYAFDGLYLAILALCNYLHIFCFHIFGPATNLRV